MAKIQKGAEFENTIYIYIYILCVCVCVCVILCYIYIPAQNDMNSPGHVISLLASCLQKHYSDLPTQDFTD